MDVQSGINVEYWFRVIYECLRGACYGTPTPLDISSELITIWFWITWIGYILSIIALGIIVYATIQLFELRRREEEQLGTIIFAPEGEGKNARWAHIDSLMASQNTNDWRQAIIEADILLDDMLTKQGYTGEGVGEKLKSVEPSDFDTLQDAWEAHKVRNQIAHSGSSFDLSETLARRTVARYETVFREFKLI